MTEYEYVEHLIMKAHEYAVDCDDQKYAGHILYAIGFASGLIFAGAPVDGKEFAETIEVLEFVAAKSLLERVEALV